MSDITLLGLSISVYTRIVRLTLAEKEVDYGLREVDIFTDDGPPVDYLRRQPFGRIPCLIHDRFEIFETSAITRYIDQAFEGLVLQPGKPTGRARMNQIISVLDAYAYRPMIWDVFVQRVIVPTEGGEPNEAQISGALPIIRTVLAELDRWLDQNTYFAGGSLTLADLHTFPMLLYFAQTTEGAAALAPYTGLLKWLDRMKQRPSVKLTRSTHG